MDSEELRERWLLYMRYAILKLEDCDLHGVADAMSDMREILAAHPTFTPPEIRVKMTVL